jgi:hypothetical protein
MDNTEYAKKLFKNIKSSPIPGVEKRIQYKIKELKKFLIEQNLNESNNSEFINDIACFSEVGYSMRQQISEQLITTITLDNGDKYDFSISPIDPKVPYPFDVICIRSYKTVNDIIFIFDIANLIGGCINGIKVEYNSEKYNG